MLHVGCAGFSIPQTRYFREFMLVEVQETLLGGPGPGTVSRWRREAPEGFSWTLLAPRSVLAGETGQLPAFVRLARTLHAKAAVLLVPSSMTPTKANRALLRRSLGSLKRAASLRWIVELPAGWPPRERSAVARDLDVVGAVDPLAIPPPDGSVAYFRLPGPAGHRSRYEDGALAQILAKTAAFDEVFAIFANADMHADGVRLRALAENGR